MYLQLSSRKHLLIRWRVLRLTSLQFGWLAEQFPTVLEIPMQVTHLVFEKFYWLAGLPFSQFLNIILIPIAYVAYLVRSAHAIDINMILCIVILMVEDKEKNQ